MRTVKLLLIVFAILASACSAHQKQVAGKIVTYKITKINCISCAVRLRDSLMKLNGIIDIKVSIKRQQVIVVYKPSKVSEDQIRKAIEEAGFKIKSKHTKTSSNQTFNIVAEV